jgi:hypothetical protein
LIGRVCCIPLSKSRVELNYKEQSEANLAALIAFADAPSDCATMFKLLHALSEQVIAYHLLEPPRLSRRHFQLSHATISSVSLAA